jgi:hypothetical protein
MRRLRLVEGFEQLLLDLIVERQACANVRLSARVLEPLSLVDLRNNRCSPRALGRRREVLGALARLVGDVGVAEDVVTLLILCVRSCRSQKHGCK